MDSPIFVIQEDGRFGALSDQGTTFDEAMDQASYTAGLAQPRLRAAVPRRRYVFAMCALGALFAALAGRALFLQGVRGASFRALADRNRVHVRVVPSPRGTMTDRHGTVLATNIPTFVLTVRAADVPAATRASVLDRAADLAGLTRADIDAILAQFADASDEPVTVKSGLSYEMAMRIAASLPDIPGFDLETSSIRSYDASTTSLSHVLGYTGAISGEEYASLKTAGYRPTNDIGKTGLERAEESVLRGVPGKNAVEVDARGHELKLVENIEPVPGSNVRLAIDLPLQRFAETRLAAELVRAHVTKGVVIALDPKDGAIRALVSLPAYDPNAFVGGISHEAYRALADNPDHPLFSRAIAGEYPAGSTFKPYVAYAALKEGVVNEHTSFLSTGGLRIGDWFFPDWKAGGHGMTDVRYALAWSINTYFYIVGGGYGATTGLGVERITDYARTFGFGARTGVDLPSEADGFLPSKEWKEKTKGERWFVGDTYHLSIGQGDLLVTPMQIASAVATIANGGTRITPHVVQAIGDQAVTPPAIEQPVFDAHDLQVVREGMRQMVTIGSARLLDDLPLPVAGKTGTAQPGGDAKTHAWFEGFGPYGDPTLAVVVLLENTGLQSSYAVPVAHDVFAWWFAHGGE